MIYLVEKHLLNTTELLWFLCNSSIDRTGETHVSSRRIHTVFSSRHTQTHTQTTTKFNNEES